ncbi:haloacid dehalogenase-like hydrolase domain-containing protein At4g39970 [Capsicum annuum]|uniref:haloacid dehalogenase-like hydrolase domain-containing protein At4g39970 n=1 Tax=Capsicum annuum TaxID=4072 RepID=UPI001FB0ECC5|nr:haloacid dehalogenase-like hydrolase domain-containing protein At4g39970 [Capsicum annuum]
MTNFIQVHGYPTDYKLEFSITLTRSYMNLDGVDQFHGVDCFLAGDDVKGKKPDPSIYIILQLPRNLAASGVGMSCVITYTSSTADRSGNDFKEAIAIYPGLSDVRFNDLESLPQDVVAAK